MKYLPYSFALGEYQGVVLYDNFQFHSAEELVFDPIVEELEQVSHEFAFELDKIPVGYNNLLFRAGSQIVLVDAGIRRPNGELCEGLEEIGIDRRDIGTVVITHSDRDHIGGILDPEGELSFSNARYIMLEDAWQHWSTEERRAELAKLNKWTKEKTQFAWETFN
jgi:glyoxylase-like metal-dependent hydrolase (beta-lactamase superfamily II)